MAAMGIPGQRRLLRQEIRQRKREVLPKLKAAIKKARSDRLRRLRECKKHCTATKKKVIADAARARRKLREHIARAKKRAQQVCTTCKATESAAALDKIDKAIAALNTEHEAIREMRTKVQSLVSERGRAGGRRRAELRAESDDMVIFNLNEDQDLISLFKSVKHKIKKGPRRTRTEAFLEYVHDHPEELDAIRAKKQRKFESEAERMFQERAEVDPGGIDELDACRAELVKLKRAEKFAEQVPF